MAQEAHEIPHSVPRGKEGVRQSMGGIMRFAPRRGGVVNVDSHSLTPKSGPCHIHLLQTVCLRFPFPASQSPGWGSVSGPLGRLQPLLTWPSWQQFLSAPDFVAVFIFLNRILKASLPLLKLWIYIYWELLMCGYCALLRHYIGKKFNKHLMFTVICSSGCCKEIRAYFKK